MFISEAGPNHRIGRRSSNHLDDEAMERRTTKKKNTKQNQKTTQTIAQKPISSNIFRHLNWLWVSETTTTRKLPDQAARFQELNDMNREGTTRGKHLECRCKRGALSLSWQKKRVALLGKRDGVAGLTAIRFCAGGVGGRREERFTAKGGNIAKQLSWRKKQYPNIKSRERHQRSDSRIKPRCVVRFPVCALEGREAAGTPNIHDMK